MYILFIVIIALGMIIYRPRIIDVIAISFLGVLTYISTNVADFSSYENIYYNIAPGKYYETGYGWYVINDLGRNLGLDYAGLKASLVVIGTLLIMSTVRYFLRCDPNMFWGLYLLYPALIDLIQIRFFIALCIVVFALRFLAHDNLRDIVIYVLLVIVAISIHTSTSFFLLFALAKYFEKYRKYVYGIIVIFLITSTLFKNAIIQIIGIFANTRQMSYVYASNNTASYQDFIFYVLMLVAFMAISQQIYKIVKNNKSLYDQREIMLAKLVSEINLCMLVLIPLLTFSSDFIRVQRISWILVYLLFTMLAEKNMYFSVGRLNIGSKLMSLTLALLGYCIMLLHYAPVVVQGFFG
ncbi:MAG: hypothetical protein HDT50_00730 [Lactobacillus sp.]|nr:hypothetical protein [Lactobacillus sp.]